MSQFLNLGLGALLIVGGVIGYTKGSNASLFASLPIALMFLCGGYFMLNSTPVRESYKTGALISLVASVILLIVGVVRFSSTGKFMPAGMLAVLGLVGTIVNYLSHK